MHHKTAHADLFTGHQHTLEGIGQEGAGDSQALHAAADRQTCQHHHGDRIGHGAPEAADTGGHGHGTGGQGHVGLHRAIAAADHKRACGPATLVAQGPLLQPSVEGVAPAVEPCAWGDRRLRDNKDAVDLQTLLRSYGAAGNFDRMTDPDQAFDRYLELGGDEEQTGAWLLGVDCGRLASAETADGLRSLLGDENLREKLIDAMAFDDRGIIRFGCMSDHARSFDESNGRQLNAEGFSQHWP